MTTASPRAARYVLLGLALLAVVLMALLMRPFASVLLFAGVLASVFVPWVDRLAARLGARRQLAAGLLTAGLALMVVLPASIMAVILGREVVAGVQYVRNTLESGGVHGLIQALPPSVKRQVVKLVGELPRGEEQLQEMADKQTGKAARAVGGALVATSSALFQLILLLIALYFLLVDGPALVDWIAAAAPLRPSQTRELLADFRRVSEATLVSSFATAGTQSLVALLGFLCAGAPQPLFLACVTFFVAFVPAVGAASVSVATAALLFVGGHPGSALFLLLWGLCVVGLTDNIVKPVLMRGRMEVHGGAIFFALLGGLAAFGPVGLVAGPLIVAFFLAIARMCQRELQRPEPARAWGAAQPGVEGGLDLLPAGSGARSRL